jgi:thymidylate kinase
MHTPEVNSCTSISFSGIDGAGKSTQIVSLCIKLHEMGLRFRLVQFWDDVAALSRVRETAVHLLFKSESGVGAPWAPVVRRDKNVRSKTMTALRLCLYLADAVSLRLLMRRFLRSGVDVVIFDRFIYDELANLNLRNRVARAFAHFILAFVPRPDFSFLLDANPVQARARKPEYPLDFLHFSRNSYLELSHLAGGMNVIAPMSLAEVEHKIAGIMMERFPQRARAATRRHAPRHTNEDEPVSLDPPRSGSAATGS